MTRPKSSTLTKSSQPDSPDVNVRGLDVAVNEAARMRFFEGLADLTQDMHHTRRRQRPLLSDQLLDVHSFEKLHREVQRAVLGDAEVVELDGVRRPQRRRRLRLAMEPFDRQPAAAAESAADPSGRISLIAAGRASMRCVAL